MRSTLVSGITAILAFVLSASLATAQGLFESKPARAVPPPVKPPAQAAPEKGLAPGLEAMLADALRNNPDIRVAEAKVHEAEAELNRVRLQVMQKVILARHTSESQKAAVAAAENRLNLLIDQHKHGALPMSEVQAAAAALAKEKAALAAVDVDLPMLLGKPPQAMGASEADPHGLRAIPLVNRLFTSGTVSSLAFSPDGKLLATQRPDGSVIVWDSATGQPVGVPAASPSAATPPARGALAEKIRRALDSPITIEVKAKPLSEVLRLFEKQFPGISFHGVSNEFEVTLHFDQMPLGAILQAVEDSSPTSLRFAVRDYGILVTDLNNPVPDGATLLHDFWKAGAGGTPAKAGQAWDAEGVIKAVDGGNVVISIGSDAGLSKGSTLEVYRLTPNPMYLGRIELVAVSPHEAVGKIPFRQPRGPVQVGDRVTTTTVQGH